MTDSTGSSPSLLTPTSTGSSNVSEIKKARRQTTFYPHQSKQQKPFSRSAAKRDSVLALGSIEHLQHYFTKTGIGAKKKAMKGKGGLVPALGPILMDHRTNDSISSAMSPLEFELPPTPAFVSGSSSGQSVAASPHVRQYDTTDPETLLKGVVEDLGGVVRVWGLDHDLRSQDDSGGGRFDVLEALKVTTRVIRGVRNYVVAQDDTEDQLKQIRVAALDVLGVLRSVEESMRVSREDEHEYHHPHAVEGGEEHEEEHADVGYSVVQVQGRSEGILVWQDENEVVDFPDTDEKREVWDERLVLGGGWLYRQDVTQRDVLVARDAIEKYLRVIEDVVFGGRTGEDSSERAWERFTKKPPRRVRPLPVPPPMAIYEEPEEETEELPDWAQPTMFVDDDLGRAYSLLHAFLPPNLQPHLSSTSLLSSLTSGQLLCIGFNNIVRKSLQPWGFISKTSIHDIISLELSSEEKETKSWTFRRIENLTLWIGALKLRYMMAIHMPAGAAAGPASLPISTPQHVLSQLPGTSLSNRATPVPSPTGSRFGSLPSEKDREKAAMMFFDAKVVARKEEGWEDMLLDVLKKWVGCVVEERRAAGGRY